ncbi:annexin B9-like isoform X2 [Planococcus citri]|uniref:annexin B9-like isoform X2 n=1 Tax=Planococcus citri TaxID=170843 RepID=UPI0031F8E9EC
MNPGYPPYPGQPQERATPTLVPIASFNPRSDAEILRKAMKGFGTDEKAIISVITKRSNSQRIEIANQFKALYGKDLISDLKSELSGKFEDLTLALMTPLPEYLAKEVQHAIEGIGTNEETLVEILCTASNAQIYAIKDAYQRVFFRSMENDLSGDTSGHFKRLLISVVQARRAENVQVDEAAVAKDARDLMTAGVLQFGTDESTFNAILCTRSYPHLRRVFTEYQRISGHTLENAIKDEFSGDIKEALLAIVRSVENKADFFAKRLRDAVACVGTKDRQLIRIVVSRCEIDMQDIKRAYQARYNKSLEQDISDDTSGDYKKALLSLIGGY